MFSKTMVLDAGPLANYTSGTPNPKGGTITVPFNVFVPFDWSKIVITVNCCNISTTSNDVGPFNLYMTGTGLPYLDIGVVNMMKYYVPKLRKVRRSYISKDPLPMGNCLFTFHMLTNLIQPRTSGNSAYYVTPPVDPRLLKTQTHWPDMTTGRENAQIFAVNLTFYEKKFANAHDEVLKMDLI